MADAKTIKESLQRDLDLLAGAREEIRLQLRLAKAEVQDEWSRLENTWQRVEGELKRIGEHTKEPVKDMGSAARTLLDELRHGYARVKSQLDESLRSGR